jgi:hypothetical protein
MFTDNDYEPSISVYERDRYRRGIYCLDVDGATVWYKNDVIHREGDEPAIITRTSKMWIKNGKRHREGDKPAIIDDNLKAWCVNNKYHREGDKPAIETRQVNIWFKHGRKHRDGRQPAVIYSNGNKEFWVNGILMSTEIVKRTISIPMKL